MSEKELDNQEDHSQDRQVHDVINHLEGVDFDRHPLNDLEKEALSSLNEPEMRDTKKALFRLIDNYLVDIIKYYFVNEKISNKEILLKFSMLKRAVEKARTKPAVEEKK